MAPWIKKKASVEKTSETTPAQRAGADRNRDANSLLSPDDRALYSGQFAVIVRVGEHAKAVIGHGATRGEAVIMAQRHAAYRPWDCVVAYVSTEPCVGDEGSGDSGDFTPV